MATKESYMLTRDREESQRLDNQHRFVRELQRGCLIHPSIPRSGLHAIADVGTGTGVWLRDVAQELAATDHQTRDFTGFDISPDQFPQEETQSVNFVVHDVLESFPQHYHENFDLVHVRFLSVALKAQDLERAVNNIIQILRPGGFLQWEEVDMIDAWALPETPDARSTISYIQSERAARGLTPAIATPLTKTILSASTAIPSGKVSPINWSDNLMRLMHLETPSTAVHPSPFVQAEKMALGSNTVIQFLQAGIARRQRRSADPQVSASERQTLKSDAEAMTQLAEAWIQGKDPATSEWNWAMTCIVARKAIRLNEDEAWFSMQY